MVLPLPAVVPVVHFALLIMMFLLVVALVALVLVPVLDFVLADFVVAETTQRLVTTVSVLLQNQRLPLVVSRLVSVVVRIETLLSPAVGWARRRGES